MHKKVIYNLLVVLLELLHLLQLKQDVIYLKVFILVVKKIYYMLIQILLFQRLNYLKI